MNPRSVYPRGTRQRLGGQGYGEKKKKSKNGRERTAESNCPRKWEMPQDYRKGKPKTEILASHQQEDIGDSLEFPRGDRRVSGWEEQGARFSGEEEARNAPEGTNQKKLKLGVLKANLRKRGGMQRSPQE